MRPREEPLDAVERARVADLGRREDDDLGVIEGDRPVDVAGLPRLDPVADELDPVVAAHSIPSRSRAPASARSGDMYSAK